LIINYALLKSEKLDSEYIEFLGQIRLFKQLLKQVSDLHRFQCGKATELKSGPVVESNAEAKEDDALSSIVSVTSTALPATLPPPQSARPVLQSTKTVGEKESKGSAESKPVVSISSLSARSTESKPAVDDKVSGKDKKTATFLTWQCFNALLFTGPSKVPEGSISMEASVYPLNNQATL
jgi:hypothetical protein